MSQPGELQSRDADFIERHCDWMTQVVHSWFRAEVRGMELLPNGPFLGVGNHSGAAMLPDMLVWVGAYHSSRRTPPLVILSHDGMFDFYPQWLAMGLSRLGAVRAKKEIALDALRQGFAVQVYPGGDYDACRSIFRRDEIIFAGRRGYVDLAREAGVPIVPVVSSGAHDALLILWDGVWLSERLGLDKRYRLKAFPLSVSVPWGLWFGPLPGYVPLPTKVRMRVLPPISPEGDPIEVDAKVRSVLQQASNELAKERRAPFCFT